MAQFGDFTVDRNSTKYVLGSGGTIIPSATDEPAFEFNADGSYKGLLVEPAATNICLQSEDFGTTWNVNTTTVTTNVATAPDGNTTADRVSADSDGSYRYIRQTLNLTATGYTFSCYLKYDGSAQWVWLLGETDRDTFFWFDLQNGVIGGSGTATGGTIAGQTYSHSIEDIGNGWYRCSAYFVKTSAAGNEEVGFGLADADEVATATSGDGVLAWGAQLETGPIATSYIPTTTASVTRNKDDINLGSASSLIGQTEGTLYLEVDWRLTTGVTQFLLIASDGTNSNYIRISSDGSPAELRMYAIAGGSTETQQGEASTAYTGIQKIAFAYKTDDFELYRNGSSVSSDTSGSLAALATLTDIDLGQRWDANNQANMWIRAVALYPKRLSDAECEALTTL
jgi:hypothetical protein